MANLLRSATTQGYLLICMPAEAAERSKSEALAAAEKGSPVVTLLAKRIRAAKKRLGKIESMEKLRDSGKPMNADQEATLASKTRTLVAMEELERLVPVLKDAAKEEADIAVKEALDAQEKPDVEHEVAAAVEKALDEERARVAELICPAEAYAVNLLQAAPPTPDNQDKGSSNQQLEHSDEDVAEAQSKAVSQLIELLYFAHTFQYPGGAVERAERNACLSYNAHPEDPLEESDLVTIAELGLRLVSRPLGEIMSHAESLARAKRWALAWVQGGSQALEGAVNEDANLSAEVVPKLERILGSPYCTTKPQMQTLDPPPVEEEPQVVPSYGSASHGPEGQEAADVEPQESHTFPGVPVGGGLNFGSGLGPAVLPPHMNGTAPGESLYASQDDSTGHLLHHQMPVQTMPRHQVEHGMGGTSLGQEAAGASGLDQHVAWGAGGVRQSGGVHSFAGDLPPPSSVEATSGLEGRASSFTDGVPIPCEHRPAAYG
eukprot:jgi/Astpho2/64/Aster-04539